ncbi:MAG: cysteine synthase A [Marinifilaceae bacterium]
MRYENVLELIGNTPIVRVKHNELPLHVELWLKLEKFNPGGSIKDRAALYMLENAEHEQHISPVDTTIIEPTSGNTGIGLAQIAALKGYRLILTMPESVSSERMALARMLGADVRLSPAAEGMKGAIALAQQLASEQKSFIPMQFLNESNVKAHYETTALEILNDVPNVDMFVAGVGSGGTITGVGKRLKEYREDIAVVAVEPSQSAVLQGQMPSPHKIQGIGAGFIPDILDMNVVDKVVSVTEEDAFNRMRQLSRQYGLTVGISSAANVHVAIELAKQLTQPTRIVTIAADGAERYLSMSIF